MIFSLERRFLLLLLLPVAIVLTAVGVAGFLYIRDFLFDQWSLSTTLKLEKAALEIDRQLKEKVELIDLIGKAAEIPNGDITRAFLIQQLTAIKGVRFVDLIPVGEEGENQGTAGSLMQELQRGITEGLYTMELCGDLNFCTPLMDSGSADRTMHIVKFIPGQGNLPAKRLFVRIAFDSLIEPVQKMGLWGDSATALVTSTGKLLAHTDKFTRRGRQLGDTGDPLEKKVLDEILRKPYGTVLGVGHPPDLVIGFYKVPSINWYLLFYSRGREILAPMLDFRFFYALGGVAVLVIILVLIRLTTRSVASSISDISAVAGKVREGNYDVELPKKRSDEIGVLMRNFNEMIGGLRQRDLIQQTFGRYVDKQIAEELMRRPEALRMGGEKKTVTIMMADMRNFTAAAEKLKPEQVIKVLNRYFGRMIDVIERYQGIIVDFYGDSILTFFDGMEADVSTRAAAAVKCALDMQITHETFRSEDEFQGLPELRVGIGIHTGEVVVGNIGTHARAKYGIVGSDVNVTARIQTTAGGGKIVISEQTYNILRDRVKVSADFRVCLKGIGGDRELYEVESLDGKRV
ncbi:MAG: adenylate/guanylate cyclase domain-containing protein [Thermodesulfobacteriota bacterium]